METERLLDRQSRRETNTSQRQSVIGTVEPLVPTGAGHVVEVTQERIETAAPQTARHIELRGLAIGAEYSLDEGPIYMGGVGHLPARPGRAGEDDEQDDCEGGDHAAWLPCLGRFTGGTARTAA